MTTKLWTLALVVFGLLSWYSMQRQPVPGWAALAVIGAGVSLIGLLIASDPDLRPVHRQADRTSVNSRPPAKV